MAVASIEFGTLAIEGGLIFSFAVVFSSTYFLFRLEQTDYKARCIEQGSSNLKYGQTNGTPMHPSIGEPNKKISET